MRLPLCPEPGGRGLSSAATDQAVALVRAGWDGLAEVAGRVPLDAASRRSGRSVREVLVRAGSWPEHEVFAQLLDDARAGRVHRSDRSPTRDALLVAAHADADAEQIRAALARARDRAVRFLESDEAPALGQRWTQSPLGLLPVSGVILAATFELAVHALDVAPADQVPAGLFDAAVAALVDTVGALAHRSALVSTAVVHTGEGAWMFGSDASGWTTLRLHAEVRAQALKWPAVSGRAADVVDAAAGRRAPLPMVLNRTLRLYDTPGLLSLATVLETVPDLPGGPALRLAARVLGQTGRLVGRIGDLARGS